MHWPIINNGRQIPKSEIEKLIGNNDFDFHAETAEALGFELLVKRAKIGQAKHIRVRPLFRNWEATGTLTVLDPDMSGITHDMLSIILDQAGALIGLCDWRPSSPAAGAFGKFTHKLRKL